MSPQMDGGLELHFDNECEDETDHKADGRRVEIDGASVEGAKDYISEVRESSLWVSLRHAYSWVKV